MADVSGWQIAGPYIAAGAALTWNAWLTWRDRHSYRLAVSWAPVLNLAGQVAMVSVAMGPEVPADGTVTLRNAGDSDLYDLTVRYVGGRDDVRMIMDLPNRARLPVGDPIEWNIHGGQGLTTPDSHQDRLGDFLVTAQYRRRPRGRTVIAEAQLARRPGEEVELIVPTRREKVRTAIAARVQPTPVRDRRDW